MYTEGFEQLFKMNKSLSAPLSEWSKIATEIYRRTVEQNLEIMSENLSRLSEQAKRLSHVKKPDELFNLQKDCLTEDVNVAIEELQQIMHRSMENMEELTRLYSLRESKPPNYPSEKERNK